MSYLLTGTSIDGNLIVTGDGVVECTAVIIFWIVITIVAYLVAVVAWFAFVVGFVVVAFWVVVVVVVVVAVIGYLVAIVVVRGYVVVAISDLFSVGLLLQLVT